MGRRNAGDVVAGIALLVCAPLALVMKFTNMGWLGAIILVVSMLLAIPVLGLVIAIDATTFFSKDSAFRYVRGGMVRSRVAA